MIIYHITTKSDWKNAKVAGFYPSHSLSKDGFIHCSTKEQVLPTARRRFQGVADLLLLSINSEKVIPEIKFELSSQGIEKHPHIFGKLNFNAVEEVIDFNPDNDKDF